MKLADMVQTALPSTFTYSIPSPGKVQSLWFINMVSLSSFLSLSIRYGGTGGWGSLLDRFPEEAA